VDFFARQEQSRRTSRRLVTLFLLAFLACALATTVVVAAALRLYMQNNALFLGSESWSHWLGANLALLAIVTGGTLGIMGLASLYRAATIAHGGGQVARLVGATEVNAEGTDPSQRRLVNVVEEMALAAGVPVPEIYILEQEAGINAFAAGTTPADAAITVTRGAVERLDRAELQGVIAHEFSHILNGDMRLNQQLIGLSFGILVLSLVGRWLLRSARFARRGRNSGGQGAALMIGLALTLIGAIGVFLSRLIKAAVSRQRERLADASAVQFTREPQGLAGALKKIAGYGARITSVDTEEVAHMLFEHGSSSFSGWFATHPPLLERIRALEPDFDPRDLPAPTAAPPEAGTETGAARAAPPGLAFAPVASAALLDRAGHIESPDVGSALREALPSEIAAAARSRDSSLLLVLALALSAEDRTREQQLRLLEQQLGATRAGLCRRLAAELSPVEPALYLPILELTVPALKRRPAEQLAYLFELLTRLGELDPTPRLFDFVLLRALEAYLRGTPLAARRARPRLEPNVAIRTLLANVAAYGQTDAAGARAAFAAGLGKLGWLAAPNDPTFDPPTAARDLQQLDAALATLAALRPRAKEPLLRSVLATIRADGTITEEERELFRLIAATLDCPLPPGSPV
jgi:Zn-dependent protease with chaperone function